MMTSIMTQILVKVHTQPNGGEGSLFHSSRVKRKGGLTDFGMDLVEMTENFGMIIDVKHFNDEGFEDVMGWPENR